MLIVWNVLARGMRCRRDCQRCSIPSMLNWRIWKVIGVNTRDSIRDHSEEGSNHEHPAGDGKYEHARRRHHGLVLPSLFVFRADFETIMCNCLRN